MLSPSLMILAEPDCLKETGKKKTGQLSVAVPIIFLFAGLVKNAQEGMKTERKRKENGEAGGLPGNNVIVYWTLNCLL